MSHAPTGPSPKGEPPRGEEILDRFAPEAAARMEEAIADAGGREVFFAGDLDAEGIVIEVRVCARGTDRAVPALFDQLRTREVVIHNHPSGNLEPSKADMELASVYSANGHGVYIIDNLAERVYVVVEPCLQSDTELLAPEDLRKLFSPGGPVARALPHFEVRRQQVDMMESVARAFNNEGIAIIEAPTGVGKTMAYLLPAILWAVRNRERIVVSTRTINLQEQIVFKDIPLLQRCLPEKFTACLVKGRGNYLCPRKLERALNETTLFDDEEGKLQLDALADWAMKTEDGSREDLPFVPERSLWERVCSESDTCTMGRCPNTQQCFVGKARRDVAKSDIVVVNHHMLFADMAIKRESGDFAALSVLPAYQRLIFDEAHSVEDSATAYLGAQATRLGAAAAFGRFQRMERGRERGLIPLLRAKLMKECPQVSVRDFEQIDARFEHHIVPALGTARNLTDNAFAAIRELTGTKAGQIGKEIKWRLTQKVLLDPDVRQVHINHVMPAVDAVAEFTRLAGGVLGRLKQVEPGPGDRESPIAAEVQQFGAYLHRLDKLAGVLSECLSEDLAENTVRWVEIDAERDQFMRLARCPLEVAKPLAEWVYGNLETIVMTSATLTVRRKFDFLNDRLGLNLIEPDRLETQCLDSPFHFEEQAFLGIVDDLPEPNAPQFLDASVDSIREVLRVTRGHAFVLFTSFRALFHAHRKLERDLRAWGITPLRQGEATRSQLIERFRNDSASVLFGTDSFWEGVDVAGDALQCVILPKLPFRVPTEPVLEARAEAIETRGGNSFVQYSVPQAVIKFRQGFGRLIRRRSDRGAVIVLDKRIVTKFYGRAFLESLPAARLVRGPQRGVLLALDQFFHGESNPEDDT